MKRFATFVLAALAAILLGQGPRAQGVDFYARSVNPTQATASAELRGCVGCGPGLILGGVFSVDVTVPATAVEIVDSVQPGANVIVTFGRISSPTRFYGDADSGESSQILNTTTYLRVTLPSGVRLVGPLLRDPTKQFVVDLDNGTGIFFSVFELKSKSGDAFFRKVASINATQVPQFDIVAGSPQAPGAVLATIDLRTSGRKPVQFDAATVNAVCLGNAFARLTAQPSVVSTIQTTSDSKRFVVGSTDGSADNAIGFFDLQPGNAIAGTVRTAAFPSTVLAVNVLEGGTNVSYGQTLPIGNGEFLLPPVVQLTPSLRQSFDQNNVIVELVTAAGTFSAPIVDSVAPLILDVGTPGLNGVVPFAEFTAEPLIAYGYGLAVSDADPGAAAIPFLGFELHDPPQSLAGFGLDDIVFVKLLVTLPLAVLDGNGGALWQQTLPNDTTFTGLPLFAQVAVLSGLDGLSMSTLSATTVGPN
ncbi:MAG: hypothetical protein NXI31_02050 [bacterium]|nr:hypothetical protein [bacterium]